ncbi:hypothetical protein [Tepidibacter sp. Z1-5]|uniref:hypothetical protein n=1 Tax=Tepidibacter sp. Z1-5 TaxID=3134138 RepID=UPI0030C50AC1
MKKTIKRISSLFLILTLFLNLSISAFAETKPISSTNDNNSSIEFTDEDGIKIKIDIIGNENSNEFTLKQYNDGVLVSTLEGEKGSAVMKRTEGNETTIVDYSEDIEISKSRTRRSSSYKNLGTMSYKVDGNKIKASYKDSKRTTTYDIKNYKGKVIDLIGIVAGAFSLPKMFAKEFIDGLIYGGALYIGGNYVKKVVGIETLAATATDYRFEICDVDDTRNSETFRGGTEYVITETNSSKINEKYKDGGFVKSDFNTESFRDYCHKQIFGTIDNDSNIY